MAIKFEKDEEEKLQQEEKVKAKEEKRKPNKIITAKLSKTPLQKWLTFLVVMSIIAVVYAVIFTFSGFIILFPTLFLWLIWIVVVVVGTCITVGVIWVSEGWNSFIGGFLDFNNNIGNLSIKITEFMYSIFPYIAGVFTLFVIVNLISTIIAFNKNKENSKGYKSKFVWAIISTALFAVAIGFDIYFYVSAL